MSVQEIHNNGASSVALSEVCIVPLDFDPERIDPSTGQLEAPITRSDELIVGRTREGGQGDATLEEHYEEEEIEIHEYRLKKQQLDWMRENYPREDGVEGLEFPALCGPEVVTCDNTWYLPLDPDDGDRAGLVYSVPFFGPEGELRGCVSGVILTHALREQPNDLARSGLALSVQGFANHPTQLTNALDLILGL